MRGFLLKISLLLNVLLIAYLYYGTELVDRGMAFLSELRQSTEKMVTLRELMGKVSPKEENESAEPKKRLFGLNRESSGDKF